MRKLFVGGLTALAIGTGVVTASPAQAVPAVPGMGCETIGWGFLGLTQKRTICDTPRRPDGSWERTRVIWTPAGYVPRSTYCGSYSCSSSGGYYRDESVQGYERYIVLDDNVVPGEPGWLPTGSVVLR